MEVKIMKTGDGQEEQVLDVLFNENEEAYIEGHSVAESAKIIEEFVTGRPGGRLMPEDQEDDQPESEGKVATITVDDGAELTLNKDNWNGESIVVKDGVLILNDESIDPAVTIKNGTIVYDGFSVELTNQQIDNIRKNATKGHTTVAFDECYMNERIDIDDVDVCINDGCYGDVIFGLRCVADRFSEVLPSIKISNGAKLDYLDVGSSSMLFINGSSGEMDDEEIVTIKQMFISGKGWIGYCHICNLTVENLGEIELHGNVTDLHVHGIVQLTSDCEVSTIHLHSGGKIYGQVEDKNIISDRPLQLFTDKGVTWVVG